MGSLRVMIVAQSLEGGGAEQVARNWMKHLLLGGAHVGVVLLSSQSDEPLHLASDPKVHDLCRLGGGNMRRVYRLRRVIRDWRPDVIISVLSYMNLVTILSALGSAGRVIISEHTIPSVMLRSQGRSQKIQLQLARILYKRAGAVIAVSHAVLADLRINFKVSSRKLWVIPNQISFASSGVGSRGAETAAALSDGNESIRLVVPGRITWAKRPDFVLAICEELSSRGHEVEVIFIGEFRDGFQFSTYARGRFEVKFSTWHDEWGAGLDSTQIVLLASGVEGFGNVLVAAAGWGLVSVAGSAAMGVADAIIPRVTGVLASPDTAEAFADAIEEAGQLRFGDVATWTARYNDPAIGGRLIKLVNSTLARARA